MSAIPFSGHTPVLLAETVDLLKPQPGETVLDVTLGLGGHSGAFLAKTSPDGRLIALDADAQNMQIAKKNLSQFEGRIAYHQMNFGRLTELLPFTVDIVFADLGLSSPHLDDAERGFTFRASAPLDMRFDRNSGETATELILRLHEDDLAMLLRKYGEIEDAGRIASVISTELHSLDRSILTDDLKAAVEKAVNYRAPKILPQIFQALRIAVNGELDAVSELLRLLPDILKKNGRAGIISYHSLEDRLVKNAFRSLSTPFLNELTGAIAIPADFEIVTKKGIAPSDQEVESNPRSRSARFRVIRRVL